MTIDLTKEDIYYAMKKMENYIYEMNENEFTSFCCGIPVNSALIPPDFHHYGSREPEYSRRIIRLEFRVS